MADRTQVLQLLSAMAREAPAEPLELLCAALRRTLNVDDVVLSIASPTWPVVAAATEDQARSLEERQLLVGDGPTVEALMTARLVESHSPRHTERHPQVRDHAVEKHGRPHRGAEDEADLEVQRSNQQRWPLLMDVLGRPVPYAGHVAVPLTAAHGPPIGVVSCFLRSHDTGTATTAEVARALSDLAEPVTHLLSLIAAVEPEHAGVVTTALPPGPATRPTASSENAREREARLHVAAGMVAVQINGSPSAALARIRAHAYVTDVSVHAAAQDIVSRRLRLQP